MVHSFVLFEEMLATCSLRRIQAATNILEHPEYQPPFMLRRIQAAITILEHLEYRPAFMTCVMCPNFTSDSVEQFTAHYESYHRDRKFKCNYCRNGYMTLKNLHLHLLDGHHRGLPLNFPLYCIFLF